MRTLDTWKFRGREYSLVERIDRPEPVVYGPTETNPGERFRAVKQRLADLVAGRAVATERLRIRHELLEAIGNLRTEWSLAKPLGEEGVKTDRDIGADTAFLAVINALDRICPAEKGE